ncbi:MAG: hypothetical protein P1U85_19030 [Verrucomicrobiales bacterium]|jgi:hypothetical protein|nr:hypothetical protein [Verrucomicrobiales bacterium]
MPKAITITPPAPAPAELTSAERDAQRLIVDSDLALQRLAESIKRGFETVWGALDNPRSKDEAQATVDALGDNRAELFARHAAIVAMLASEGLATFEPWETVPAYPVDDQGQLGELAPEWSQ